MTPVLKCVPPNDKPKAEELKNCFNFLTEEFLYLGNAKVFLALGKVAFDSCLSLFKLKKSINQFSHGKVISLSTGLRLVGCYHPSPRNVNTKRINEFMMLEILKKLKDF